jgi:glycosyltransferase involved in cell wall biosynthesis
MHYHVSTFQELERRIESEGGEFIVVSGKKRAKDTGRVPIADTVVRRHLFLSFSEWTCGKYTFRSQPELPNLIRRIVPDVVIVMGHVGSITYWRLGRLAKRMGFKYMSWQCGYEYNSGRLKHELTRRFFKLFDHHLAYNTNAKKYLLSNEVDEARITVIHNTINEREINLIPHDKAREMVVEQLGLPSDRPIILYVGAILAEKGLDVLIDAVRRLRYGAVSLIIVGDGPALPSIKAKCSELDCVRFPGRVVKGVGRFFDAANIFVLPGTGGLAINEAMAHGLPIISSFADGSAEDLVIDQINGYVLKRSDADEIAMKLDTLLSDPEGCQKMGDMSRELITTMFSFRTFISHTMNGIRAGVGDEENDTLSLRTRRFKNQWPAV